MGFKFFDADVDLYLSDLPGVAMPSIVGLEPTRPAEEVYLVQGTYGKPGDEPKFCFGLALTPPTSAKFPSDLVTTITNLTTNDPNTDLVFTTALSIPQTHVQFGMPDLSKLGRGYWEIVFSIVIGAITYVSLPKKLLAV